MPARVSRNQDLVLGALRTATGRALTAYEVLAQLGPAGIRGPQTVYRALDALQQAGLVAIEAIGDVSVMPHAWRIGRPVCSR